MNMRENGGEGGARRPTLETEEEEEEEGVRKSLQYNTARKNSSGRAERERGGGWAALLHAALMETRGDFKGNNKRA